MYLEDLQVPKWTTAEPKHKDFHPNNLEREKVKGKENKKTPKVIWNTNYNFLINYLMQLNFFCNLNLYGQKILSIFNQNVFSKSNEFQ